MIKNYSGYFKLSNYTISLFFDSKYKNLSNKYLEMCKDVEAQNNNQATSLK